MGVVTRLCTAVTIVVASVLTPPAARADAAVVPGRMVDYRAGYGADDRANYRANFRAEGRADYLADYRPDAVFRWQPYIDEASVRFGIPASWIVRVIRAESAGRTTRGGRPIRSRAGAMGLMQLMPATWADMRGRLGLGGDPDDPRANILAGTFYLRLMYDRFGYPGLFGAYNAGPARYAAYLDGRQRLPGETTAYLAQVADRTSGSAAGRAASYGPGGLAEGISRTAAGNSTVSDAGKVAGLSARPAMAPLPTLFVVRRDFDAETEAPAAAIGAAALVPETALFAIRKTAP